jgi:hypothetical protein
LYATLDKFNANIDNLLIFFVNLGFISKIEDFAFLTRAIISLAAFRLTSGCHGGRGPQAFLNMSAGGSNDYKDWAE